LQRSENQEFSKSPRIGTERIEICRDRDRDAVSTIDSVSAKRHLTRAAPVKQHSMQFIRDKLDNYPGLRDTEARSEGGST
jgi:hypothetical protein